MKRIIPSENGLTTSLFFFLENAKQLGQSDDAKQGKKRGWPNANAR